MHGDRFEQLARVVKTVSVYFPPGWLAYGAFAAAEANVWPGILGALGMFIIGAASLWRSYHTTLRFYRGTFQSSKGKALKAEPTSAADKKTANWLEIDLRWLSEYASVIALANLRSLARAPEVKMVMIGQVILLVICGSMLATGSDIAVPEGFRPLLAMGAIVLTMFSLLQLLLNQFGFDRNGFRVFILTAAPRREILLGKNISLAPIALGTGAIALVVLQFVYTLRVTHFLASLIQLVSVFIIFCMVGNMTSIFVPMAMSTGSLKPANPRLLTVLIQMLTTFLSPIAVIPLSSHWASNYYSITWAGEASFQSTSSFPSWLWASCCGSIDMF